MTTLFLHKGIISVIDLVTGFKIKQALEESLAFDYLSREEIKAYQDEQFQRLSEIASRSEYYKNFANKRLEQFPLMSREVYSMNNVRLNTNYHSVFYHRRSSGSTGSPVEHQITKDMLLAKRVSHQKMLAWYGLDRVAPELKIGGMPVDRKTRLYYLLRNKLYFNSYLIREENIPKLVRRYNSFKPALLYGYPSLIHNFLTMSERAGYELNPPKLIVTHAENLYREYRETFARIFPGSKVVNQYWATEGNIAETCPHGNMHISEDTVICEVLNRDKNGTGDLYLTNLFSFRIPIIRYRTGDRVKLSARKCTCGRNTKIIDRIEGREIEYLGLPDGRKHPVTAIYLTSFTSNILTYQLVQYPKENRVLLRYIPVDRNLPIEKDRIRKHMKEKFGLETEFLESKELEYSPGGKIKRIIVND